MKVPVLERFRKHYVVASSGCWEWTGYRARDGYGQFGVDGRVLKAHRVSYELHVAPIPAGLTIDHLCRVRYCVNPAHLEPVTMRENTLRGNTIPAIRAAQTHCIHGHEFTPENTRRGRNGARICRECRRRISREDSRRRRARARHLQEKETSQ